MKKKVFLITFILTVCIVFSQTKPTNQLSKEELASIAVKDITEIQFKNVLRSISAEIDSSRIANRTIPQFYKFFVVHGAYTGKEEDFSFFLHEFLNVYNQRLISPEYLGIPPMHFYKRMFELNLAGFFEDYVIDPELKVLDFNAYEIVNGEKETLLDFINLHLKKGRGDSDTLIFIRDTLHDEFGAKFGYELDRY